MNAEFKELKTRNILSKEQMRNIRGGGTCGYYLQYEDGSYDFDCNKPKSEVDHMFNGSSAVIRYWCCDSCGSTFYCGGKNKGLTPPNLQTSYEKGVTCP